MRTVTLTFDDGSKHVYQNVPMEITPNQIHQRASQEFQGKRVINIDGGQPSSNMLTQGIAGFKDAAVAGAGGLYSGLAALEGVLGGQGKEERVQNLLDSKKRMEEYWRTNHPELNVPPQGVMQAIARGAGQIPQYASLATAVPQIFGRGMQEAESIINEGGDKTSAMRGGLSSMALNTAALALPPALGGGIKTRAVTGAGLNVGQEYADVAAQNLIRKTIGLKEKEYPTKEEAIAAATLGAGFGAMHKGREKPDSAPSPEDTSKVLDEADATGQTPRDQVPKPETIWDKLKYQEQALAETERQRNTPLQVTPDGQVIPQGRDTFWTGQGDNIAPESLTPRRLEQPRTSKDYFALAEDLAARGDVEGYKSALSEAQRLAEMEIGERIKGPERPLPDLNIADENYVPRIPGTEEPPVAKRTPYPETNVEPPEGTGIPEAGRLVKEASDLDTMINEQYQSILKMEEMISGEGMTSEMLGLRDQLVNDQYTKLDELQKKREALNEEPPPENGQLATPFDLKEILKKWKKVRDENAKKAGLGGRGRQSGHISSDFFGLKTIANKIKAAIDNYGKPLPKSTNQAKADAVNNIPGLADINMVTPDPEMTPQAKQNMLNEGNSTQKGSGFFANKLGQINRAWLPGRIAVQEVRGKTNELIAYVGRILENSKNRYEINKDRYVEPVKRAFYPLLKSENSTMALADVFFRELKNGSRYSEDILRKALSPNQFEAYTRMREGFDRTRDMINEIRELKGLKPITMLEAYMASTWAGPWKAKVYDANNNLVWVIAEQSYGQRQKAMDYLKGKDSSLKFSEVEYDSRGQNRTDGLQAGYDDLITILGSDNLVTQTVKELLTTRFLGETQNIAGVEQHFKKKTGVKGYAGDRPWVDKFKDQKDMFSQQIRYMDGVFRWYEHQKALPKIDLALKDPEIREKRMPDITWLEEHIRQEEGIGTAEAMRRAEDAMLEFVGSSPKKLAGAEAILRSYFYMAKLGYSATFATVSLIQPFLSVPPALLAHKGKFGIGVGKMLTDGYAMALHLFGNEIAQLPVAPEVGRFLKTVADHPLDNMTKEAIEYARANRVAELNQMSDVRDVEAGTIRNAAEKFIGPTITLPEMIARSQAFMAYVHAFKHKYDTSTKEGRLSLYEKAAEVVKESMADYERTQKSALYQRLGVLGHSASALQTFMVNHMYQNWKYAQMAAKGDPLPFLMLQFMQWTVAGAIGAIGIDDAENLWQKIKANLPHDAYIAVEDLSIKKAIIDNMEDWVAYGPASKITGANLYSRFSTSNMARVPPFEPSWGNSLNSMVPFLYDAFANQIPAAWKLAMPGYSEMDKQEAFHAILPTNLKGWNENRMMKDGIVPQMSKQQYGGVRRTEKGVSLRNWGFKELREQIQQDELYNEKATNAIVTEKIKDVRDDFVRGVIAGNSAEVGRSLKRAVDLGYNPTSWMSSASMNTIAMNKFLPIIEREMAKLSNKKNLTKREATRFQIWQDLYQRTK